MPQRWAIFAIVLAFLIVGMALMFVTGLLSR
jgi:hypothetical protein